MKRYLLDTTPLTAYLLGRPYAGERFSELIDRGEVATSFICYAEVNEYIRGFANYQERLLELRNLLRLVRPYSPTYSILERYGEIRRALRGPNKAGLIGDIDTLIASTALEYDLTLITVDRDFERVPDLRLELIPQEQFRR